MASQKAQSIVLLVLMSLGIVFAITLMLLQSYNPKIFAGVLGFYFIGSALYTFIIFELFKGKIQSDLRYDIASYFTLYNIIIGISVMVSSIFFMNKSFTSRY